MFMTTIIFSNQRLSYLQELSQFSDISMIVGALLHFCNKCSFLKSVKLKFSLKLQ